MKLVASMPVKDEMSRYLKPCITALEEYVDEIRVLDDGSTDGTFEWLHDRGVRVERNTGASWGEHEGQFRQALLDWTREAEPTHILAIDADEFVADGSRLREAIRSQNDQMSFSLTMREVWATDPWQIREDGGWRSHEVSICFRVPQDWGRVGWKIENRQFAGGRVPRIIKGEQRIGDSFRTGVEILHLGWARVAERAARYDRYTKIDGGQFHAGSHLDSIMNGDDDCVLVPYRHPPSLTAVQ